MLNEQEARLTFEMATEKLSHAGFEVKVLDGYDKIGRIFGKDILLCPDYGYTTMLNALFGLVQNYYLCISQPNRYTPDEMRYYYMAYVETRKKPKYKDEFVLLKRSSHGLALMRDLLGIRVIENATTN